MSQRKLMSKQLFRTLFGDNPLLRQVKQKLQLSRKCHMFIIGSNNTEPFTTMKSDIIKLSLFLKHGMKSPMHRKLMMSVTTVDWTLPQVASVLISISKNPFCMEMESVVPIDRNGSRFQQVRFIMMQ